MYDSVMDDVEVKGLANALQTETATVRAELGQSLQEISGVLVMVELDLSRIVMEDTHLSRSTCCSVAAFVKLSKHLEKLLANGHPTVYQLFPNCFPTDPQLLASWETDCWQTVKKHCFPSRVQLNARCLPRRMLLWLKTEKKKMVVGSYYANNLLTELKLEDGKGFRKLTCMSPIDLEVLLQIVGPRIIERDTRFRSAIPPAGPHCLLLEIKLRARYVDDMTPSIRKERFKRSHEELHPIVDADILVNDIRKEYISLWTYVGAGEGDEKKGTNRISTSPPLFPKIEQHGTTTRKSEGEPELSHTGTETEGLKDQE
uniref:Uncharacterized protein n=1 Tax=Timema bartmani TaxID=61472 RepID=A0A7R9F0A6_9NEOP|nr:unnamed protein product [Timema bartmani]